MSKRIVSFAAFEQVVKRLQGQLAWRGRAGSGTGSIFTLQFGPALANDEKQGEFSLIVSCAWRIVEAGNILCTWHENSDEALAPALKNLEGMQVAEAVLSELGDLTIYFTFTTGRILHIWNDAPYTEGDSWFICYQGAGCYAVEIRNAFTYESED